MLAGAGDRGGVVGGGGWGVKKGERWKTSVILGWIGDFLGRRSELGKRPKWVGSSLFHVEHFLVWAGFPECSTWNKAPLTTESALTYS